MSNVYLTTEELAARWRMTRIGLQDWRRAGKGPKFIQLEGKHGPVRYRLVDVEDYERDHEVTPREA